MKKTTTNSIIRLLRELESIACDLEAIMDKLNCDSEQEYHLGTVMFELVHNIYIGRNKIKKILDNLKIN